MKHGDDYLPGTGYKIHGTAHTHPVSYTHLDVYKRQGTYGVDDWESADKYWRNYAKLQMKSFISIIPEGLTVFPPVSPTKPEEISVDRYVEVLSRNRKRALGVKIQLGWLPYKSVETDTALLRCV